MSHCDIPDILKEVAIGHEMTSVCDSSNDCCLWEVTMNECLKPTFITEKDVVAKKGDFDITFGKLRRNLPQNPCWVLYTNNNLNIVSQVVMVNPNITKKHAKIYRKTSLFIEHENVQESIVILFDLGVAQSGKGQRFPVGRVIFQKEYIFVGDIKLCLSFDLTILSDFLLMPTYRLRNFKIPAFITMKGRYEHIGDQSCKSIDSNNCQETFAKLFADYKHINPYSKGRNLSIFNNVLIKPPQQLMDLFE